MKALRDSIAMPLTLFLRLFKLNYWSTSLQVFHLPDMCILGPIHIAVKRPIAFFSES
jgi:hypothetical protein